MSDIGRPAGRPDQAAVAVIVQESNLLAIRRSRHVRAPGKICLPGGGIEADESSRQAIVREMREEINVDARPLKLIWQSVSPWGVSLHWWLTSIEGKPSPNPDEVESIHWMSVESLLETENRLESLDDFLIAIQSGHVKITCD